DVSPEIAPGARNRPNRRRPKMPSEYDFLLPYSRYSRSLRRTGRGWRMALLAAAFGAGVVSTALIVALPLRPFTPDDRASHKAARSAANTTFGATSGQADPPRPSPALTPDAPAATSSSTPRPAGKPAEPHAPTRTAMQAERASPSITGADEPVPQPRPRPLALAKEQPAAPAESATASAPAPAGAAEKPTATRSTDGAVPPVGNDRPSGSRPAVASRDAETAAASGETAAQSHGDRHAGTERRRARSERTYGTRQDRRELSRQEQRRIARTRDDQEQRQYRSVVRARDDDGGRDFVDAYGGREGREFVDAYGVRHVILSRRGDRSRMATDTDRDRASAFESGWRPRRFFIFGPSADDDE